MTTSDVDNCRATGIWPGRPMTPFEPLPARTRRRTRRSRAHTALMITWNVIVVLVLLSAAGGIAYVLSTGQT